jgi:hypothetical protein
MAAKKKNPCEKPKPSPKNPGEEKLKLPPKPWKVA